MKKIVSLLLVIVLLASTFTSCIRKRPDVEDNKKEENILDMNPSEYYEGGTHIRNYNVIENEYLVRNGSSDYKIVYPKDASDREMFALSELQSFFLNSTGVLLPAVTDDSVSYAENSRFISIGNNAIASSAGITLNEELLKDSGARIETKGKSIFVLGCGDLGTLNAVYEFLGITFNWEVYSDNTVEYDKNVTYLNLLDFDVTEVPDFLYNYTGFGYVYQNAELRQRFRNIDRFDNICAIDTKAISHNTFIWLPVKEYQAEHPKWYNPDVTNLCYYAQGDDEELELLIQEVVKKMKTTIINHPDKKYISFTHQDTQTLCSCDYCKQMKIENGGSEATGVIRFLNEVRARIQVWFDTEAPELDNGQQILFFAYHATNKPPVYLENGEYKPYSEDLICKDIVPWFAETNGDYTVPLNKNEKVNGDILNNLKGWTTICEDVMIWNYSTNYVDYLTPYYAFESIPENYRIAVNHGVGTMFDLNQLNNNNSTGWERLKGYLNYKYSWNVNYSFDELVSKYFEASYGPASDTMKELFDEYRVLAKLQIQNGYSGSRSIFHNAATAKYWPRNILVDWLNKYDEALKLIEPLKETDREKYEAYYFNIVIERVAVYYQLIVNYSSTIDTATLNEYKNQFKTDCAYTGINRYKEVNGLINQLFITMGVN